MDERLIEISSKKFFEENNLLMIAKLVQGRLKMELGQNEFEVIRSCAEQIDLRMRQTGVEKESIPEQVMLMNQRLLKRVIDIISTNDNQSTSPLPEPTNVQFMEKVKDGDLQNRIREREIQELQLNGGGGLNGRKIDVSADKYFSNSTSFATTPAEFKAVEPEKDSTNIVGTHSVMTTDPNIVQKAKFDISHQSFIAPDTIFIDSRLRNRTKYPNANKFTLPLEVPFTNVYAVRVVSASIPNSQYIINSNNNKIYFRETNSQATNGTYTTATLNVGNYTISNLITEINTQLATVSIATLTASVDTTNRRVTIASNLGGGAERFDLVFTSGVEIMTDGSTSPIYIDGTIARVLGFKPENLTGAATYTSDGIYNLTPSFYCLLKIDEFQNFTGVRNTSVNGSLTEIPFTSSSFEYSLFRGMSDNLAVKILKIPMNRLTKLDVSLLNYDGSYYDTNGYDWSAKLYIYRLDTKNN